MAFERIVAPGNKACLYGDNLDKVESILIGGMAATDITYVESEDGNYVEYTVPAGLSEGDYRAIFIDAEGNEYGANKVKVTKGAMITMGANRATVGTAWIMTGINLDAVASVAVADVEVVEFAEQTTTSLTLICPELAEGEYTVTGKTKTGESIQFYAKVKLLQNRKLLSLLRKPYGKAIIMCLGTKRTVIQNKSFNLIPQEVMTALKPGTIFAGVLFDRAYSRISSDATCYRLVDRADG